MKYRVMQELNYAYKGDDMVAAIAAFQDLIGDVDDIDENVNEITKEPMLIAFNPDTGDLVAAMHGITKEQYNEQINPSPKH